MGGEGGIEGGGRGQRRGGRGAGVVVRREDNKSSAGGRGWMVAGSRVNHYLADPPQVEIEVYHFSAAQGGYVIAHTEDDHSSSGTKVVIKCFIDTAAVEGKPSFGLLTLLWLLGTVGLLPAVKGLRFYRVKMLARRCDINN